MCSLGVQDYVHVLYVRVWEKIFVVVQVCKVLLVCSLSPGCDMSPLFSKVVLSKLARWLCYTHNLS